MSQKYVIGLTGNIATGKSIVRRMLQELGASTVDADSLVHVLQRPGTPVYREISETFGSFVLNKDATINRKRLGDIAFSSPEALRVLEAIIHPAVRQHIERAVERAPTDIVVIEAIKLMESGLADKCDAIWVVNASEDTQMLRLMTKRNMSSQMAMRRIKAQPPQAEKLARANVIIENDGDVIKTWNLVQQKFNEIPKSKVIAPEPEPVTEEATDEEIIEIRRAKRNDLSKMAALISNATKGEINLDEGEMMERLFSKGYLVAIKGDDLAGLIGWQAENLIAGVDDFFVKNNTLWPSIGAELMQRVEEAVAELSCEAGLVFLHHKTGPIAKKYLESRGYEEKQVDELEDRMWREAAQDWAVENTILMFKQLLERRINMPI
jgi:dephospho-CoA kinase